MSECTFVGLWKITRAYLFQIALKIVITYTQCNNWRKCNINAKWNNFWRKM